ncbi:MAG: FtsX-like permease family protein, partial [Gemmatimonadota bacterium]
NLASLEPGFDRNHVLLFAVYPATLGYQGDREHQLYQQLRARLEATPGVRAAATSRTRLVSSGREACTPVPDAPTPTMNWGAPVSPRFFATMGVPLERGREFDDGDRTDGVQVAIVSAAAGKVFFPRVDPLGREIHIEGETGGRTVVGVVGDVGTYSSDPSDRGLPSCNVYIPVTQAPSRQMGQQWIEVRADGDPAALLPSVRQAVGEVDSHLSLFWPGTVEQEVRDLYGTQMSLAMLSGVFGALALTFAAIGLLGIVSYGVATRRGELGLRIALGATPFTIIGQILQETMALVLLGAVLGVLGAVGSTRLLSGLLYGVSPLDLVSIVGAILLLLVIGLLAAYLPARRAARLDPAITLRNE